MPSHEVFDVTVSLGDRITVGRKNFYWQQLEELARLVRDYREEGLPFDTQLALAAFRGAMKAQEDVMLEEERYKALQNCVLTLAAQLSRPHDATRDLDADAEEIARSADGVRAADRRLANATEEVLATEDVLPVRNPEYARGHHDGYAQGSVHAAIGQKAKLELALKAAEETQRWAYELTRDSENVFGAAGAIADALMDLTADEEGQKAEQRLTTAKLAAEYSRSANCERVGEYDRSHLPLDQDAVTIPVTVAFLRNIRGALANSQRQFSESLAHTDHQLVDQVDRVLDGVNNALREAQVMR